MIQKRNVDFSINRRKKIFFMILIVSFSILYPYFVTSKPIYTDAFFHSKNILIILKENKIVWNTEPYLRYPLAYINGAVLAQVMDTNAVIVQRFLSLAITIFIIILFTMVYSIVGSKKIYEYSVIFSTMLFFALYWYPSTYSPQLFSLSLLILYVAFIFTPKNMTFRDVLPLTFIWVSVALGHHVTSIITISISLSCLLLSKRKLYSIPIIIILLWFIYIASQYVFLGYSIIESLNKIFLVKQELELQVYGVYNYVAPLQAVLSMVRRTLIVIVTLLTLFILIKKGLFEKKRTAKCILVTLVFSVIVTLPLFLTGMAIERFLLFNGLWLSLVFPIYIFSKNQTKKHKEKRLSMKKVISTVVSIMVVFSVVSYSVLQGYEFPRQVPTNYEIFDASFLSKQINLKGIFFSDLPFSIIFKYMILKNSIYSKYKIIHDRFAYQLRYLLDIFLNKDIILYISQRTENRFFMFYGYSIKKLIHANNSNIVYNTFRSFLIVS